MTPLSKGPEYYYQVLASKSLRQLDTLKNGLPWIGFLQDFSIIPVWFDDQFDREPGFDYADTLDPGSSISFFLRTIFAFCSYVDTLELP